MEEDNCPVCLENIEKYLCLYDICLTCRKMMCKKCLKDLEKCPHCRTIFNQSVENDIKRAEKIIEEHKDYKYIPMIYYFLACLHKNNNDEDNYNKYLKISVEKGFSCALNALSVDCDNEEYLDLAVEKDCLAGLFNKSQKELEKENYEVAKELLIRAADGGYSEAQYLLGYNFIEGNIFDEDIPKGVEYIQKAADNGDVEASFELSNIYYNGYEDIIQIDRIEAIKYATFAAGKGHELARFNLGTECYVNKFYYESFKWLKPLVEKGNKSAKLLMAKSYIEMSDMMGNFILKEGLIIVAEMADEQHPPSLYELGLIYFEGNKFIEEDKQKSFTLVKGAADLDYISSYSKLSEMYVNGIGTEVNLKLGAQYGLASMMNISIDNIEN